MEILGRKYRILNASCAGSLSWWRIYLSDQSPGLFLWTNSRNIVCTSK